MKHICASIIVTGLSTFSCGHGVTPELEEVSSVSQGVLIGPTNCLDGSGQPITYTASPPSWPADASASIQATIDAAKSHAHTNTGSMCMVRAYIPNGTWLITDTLFVPSRVHLMGQDINLTRIIKVPSPTEGGTSAIELSDPDVGTCAGISHAKVQQLRIEMRDAYNITTPPTGGNHCIRSRTGITNFEIRNVNLKNCAFYGISLGFAAPCSTEGSPYKDFTIKGVKLDWSGSDGIDMKALAGAESNPARQNSNGRLHDLCFANIGQNGDGNWDSALDLAGDDLWVSNVQAINNTKLSLTSGIDLGGGDRRVTNSLIEKFYVKKYDLGITADAGSGNVVFSDGALKENTFGANLEPTTYNIDTFGDAVCASLNTTDLENDQPASNDWTWGSCPTLSNPACSY